MDRWEGLRRALSGFLAEHGSQHELAATSFPRFAGANVSCDASDYETPLLDWAAAPSAIDAFMSGVSMRGASPLGPALAGAIRSARQHHVSWGLARSTSVIVLTDTTPQDDETCASSDWDEVAATAGKGFALGQGATVHVDIVSVMGRASSPDHFGLVSEVAIRGGGVPAFVNGSTEDIERSARRALEMIRDRRTTCTLLVPVGVQPDELTLTFADGTVETAERVPDAAACHGRAFYLDDPSYPSTATLCSGEAGIGGYCEMTFIRASMVGRPTVMVSQGTLYSLTVP